MMSFDEIIQKSLVCLNMAERSGQDVIEAMIEAAVREGALSAEHRDTAIRTVLNRELSASTALGDGVALPHGRVDCVSDIVCVFGIHPDGIEFGAADGSLTHVFVLMLTPLSMGGNHVQFLAALSRRLIETSVRNGLLAAKTRDDVLQLILANLERGTF